MVACMVGVLFGPARQGAKMGGKPNGWVHQWVIQGSNRRSRCVTERREALHDGWGLDVKIAVHFIGAPASEERDAVAIS